MKCFFHKSDMDGKCSGAIVKRYAKKVHDEEVELIGIQYGECFPWEKIEPDETVFMVDFCLEPFSDMIRLNEIANLVWIDHHISALNEANLHRFVAKGGQSVVVGLAGCELTWEHCFPDDEMPKSVFLLGRYDVWDHENNPGSLAYQYGVRQFDTRPDNDEFWIPQLGSDEATDEIIKNGEVLLNFVERQDEAYCKSCAFEMEFEGLRCITVNKGLTSSLLFKSVYDREKHDIMLTFCYRKKKFWTVSLYSDKAEIDVSQIAKKYDGGGHKGAAGFQCEELPFEI